MSAQVTGSPLGRPVARDEKSIDACTATVIAIVCDFAAHLMLKILSTDAQSMGAFSLAERINGLRPERLGSHGAQAKDTSDASEECRSVAQAVKRHHLPH